MQNTTGDYCTAFDQSEILSTVILLIALSSIKHWLAQNTVLGLFRGPSVLYRGSLTEMKWGFHFFQHRFMYIKRNFLGEC